MEKDALSPEPVIYSIINQSPLLKSPSTNGGKIYGHHPWSPMWMEGLHKMGCSLVNPRGLLTTLLSLTQSHAAFSTIPSTLAWVDQRPVSQRVVVTLYRVSPPHLSPPPMWPRVQVHITLRYGWGVGFMGGWKNKSITYSDCVSFALVIQYAMFMHHIVLCGLSVSTIFFYGTIFRKKLLCNKCVLCFSLQIFMKHFSFEKEFSEILSWI
jgi:hypothetical protein